MIGRQERWQEDIFVACRLSELVPPDHILRRIDKELDLSWFRDEIKDLYDENNGRPSIDPEAALRLMIAGFVEGIREDRKLMRQAQVNVAIRWFAGYRLDEKLPDHSSLTRIRQRWGEERFRRIFLKVVERCDNKGLVGRETVHIDATLIRADVSWKSLTERHVEEVLKENAEEEPEVKDKRRSEDQEPGDQDSWGRQSGSRDKQSCQCREARGKGKVKKYSSTDPEASMATSSRGYHLEPTYKSHVAVDDKAGVIVDVDVTTGEASEGKQLLEQIERIEAATGSVPKTVTADAGYAHSSNYAGLEAKGIEALISPQRETRKCSKIPLRRFKYDALHEIVRCPRGRTLEKGGRRKNGWVYRAKAADCRGCAVRGRCFAQKSSARTVVIVDGYEALLRGRRGRQKWDKRQRELYDRHRWRAEGTHGEAKTSHGMRRAARRGLWNVSIQAYLAATVINLKRLAKASLGSLFGYLHGLTGVRSARRRLREVLRPRKTARQGGVAMAA